MKVKKKKCKCGVVIHYLEDDNPEKTIQLIGGILDGA